MKTDALERTYCWLLPTLRVYRDGARLLLRDSERQAVFTRHVSEVLAALELIDGSCSLDSLLREGPIVGSLLAELLANRWLVQLSRPLSAVTGDDDVCSRQLSYFAHLQRHLPDLAFAELASKRVLIVGTGGIGSHVAVELAGCGVRKLVLNDPDTVSASNLNRQIFFTRSDVGQFKVDVLARALKARFDDLEIETSTVNHDHEQQHALEDCDAVVVCGECESIWTRPALVAGKPLLMAGYFGCRAVVGPCILPDAGPSWSGLMRDRDTLLGPRVALNHVTRPRAWNCSGATINTAAAGLLGEATLRMLAPSLGGPILVGERLELDMRTLRIERIRFAEAETVAGTRDHSAAVFASPEA